MPPFLADEQRNYKIIFMILSVSLALAAVWAFFDEDVTRRPWKQWQRLYAQLLDHGADQVAVAQLVVPELQVVDRCTTCHAGIDNPAMVGGNHKVLQVHPQRDTLLKHHPSLQFGCTPCHRGQGLALTEGTAHGLGDPHWLEPLLRGPYVQASCLGCHAAPEHLAGAEILAKGKQLFTELGCAGCHATGPEAPPRRGPSLVHVAQKLLPGYMVTWIANPEKRRARYQMPQFWPKATTDPSEATRRDREVLAIAAYLLEKSEAWPMASAATAVAGERAALGKALFDQVGCRGCHALGGGRDTVRIAEPKAAGSGDAWADFGGNDAPGDASPVALAAAATIDFAPPLGEVASRLQPGFIANWLRDPSQYWREARMPTPRLVEGETLYIQSYLHSVATLPVPPTPAALATPRDPKLVEQGLKLITVYGCAGCHEIPGFATDARPGPDLADYGSKDPRDMLQPTPPPPRHQRTWERATEAKLLAPQALSAGTIKLVMPDYGLQPEQVQALAVFLRGLRSQTTPAAYRAEPAGGQARLQAENLIQERGCQQCHQLRGLNGGILRYYEQAHLAPPSLDVAGKRLQPQWMFSYLLEPAPVRPWLQVRMPQFRFTPAEAENVTAWLAENAGKAGGLRPMPIHAVSPQRAEMGAHLFERLKCVTCHRLVRGDGVETAQLAPDLGLARQRLDPAWVRNFIEDPGKVLPGTKMPQFFPDGQSPTPDVLGGNVAAQMELLVDYLMNLGLLPVGAEPPAPVRKGAP